MNAEFEYCKCLITGSQAHEVVTKMTKVEKSGGGTVNMWSLNQKISELVFVKPDIPVLKDGRDMEIEVANTFVEFIKGKHKDIKSSDCGLFVDETLPYVGASPDRILLCSCCEKACVDIKCPPNLEYLRLCDGKTALKKSHKCYTLEAQMAVTKNIKNYFEFGMIIDEIFFDNESWCSMKNKFQKYY